VTLLHIEEVRGQGHRTENSSSKCTMNRWPYIMYSL